MRSFRSQLRRGWAKVRKRARLAKLFEGQVEIRTDDEIPDHEFFDEPEPAQLFRVRLHTSHESYCKSVGMSEQETREYLALQENGITSPESSQDPEDTPPGALH